MHLHWSAITLAGHVTLCLAILLILWNALAVLPAAAAGLNGTLMRLASPLFGFGAAFIVERAYYVAARLLVNSGVNLWELHPAPDLLSGIVAVMAFWVACAVRLIGRDAGLSCRRVLLGQGAAMLAVFGLLAWGLW